MQGDRVHSEVVTKGTITNRRDQVFPLLSSPELARVARFGTRRSYSAGERLYAAGERPPGMFVILSGSLTLSQRDGFGHVVPMVRLSEGQFSGELGALSGTV